INKLKPMPEKLIYPEGERYRVVDDIVQANIRYVNPKLTRRETSVYHGKILRPQDAKKILSLDVDVDRPQLPESILPYPIARDFILKSPDHICVVDCACRSVKADGCYPRDVCMIVGEPFVSFIMDHGQDSHPRIITREEALAIIDAEHERGHVHTAFFKDAMGDRFYAICNCCSCCCNSMAAYKYANAPIFAASGYVRTTTDNCIGCGSCVEICPFDALALVEGKAVVDTVRCVGCGKCEAQCKNDGVILQLDPGKGEPLDMDILLAQ
ncbi:MAG TPA: 4Fe-4S binding protein, partial [Syntrophomonas sp.]|nr:4Fe-4S binding protein [Syntrophomonas sp.]